MNIPQDTILRIREKFPILDREVYGRRLVYLDNAATSQTPRQVVETVDNMYYHTKANVHRGVHTLSQEATDMQEHTRRRVKEYINARSIEEIVFTRGTTEAINLVASSYGQAFLHDGEDYLITVMKKSLTIGRRHEVDSLGCSAGKDNFLD